MLALAEEMAVVDVVEGVVETVPTGQFLQPMNLVTEDAGVVFRIKLELITASTKLSKDT